jgi:hypothetical protein
VPNAPAYQRTRSRANCDCGGPCFYCGRPLAMNGHHHDHFPVAYRHGGEHTVPACGECHRLKEGRLVTRRAKTDDLEPVMTQSVMDGIPDDFIWSVMLAVMNATMDALRSRDRDNDFVHDLLRGDTLNVAEDLDAWADWTVEQCTAATTAEARIWLAQAFSLLLDRVSRTAAQLGASS